MRKKNKNLINPNEMTFANLVKFTDDDVLRNKIPNMNLRCTHESYILGTKEMDADNLAIFLDAIYDDNNIYPYFNSITEAEYELGEHSDKLFVLGALPVTMLGVKKPCTKEEMLNRIINTHELYFNFSDDEAIKERYNILKK